MVLKKFIVLTGISLLSLVAIAQAESIARQSQIKHKYIVTTKDSNQRSTAKLISALAAAGFERVKIKSLFPQFCQLSKRNGKSPEVNHLRMLEAGIESLHELDTSRNAALRSYLKMPSSKKFLPILCR